MKKGPMTRATLSLRSGESLTSDFVIQQRWLSSLFIQAYGNAAARSELAALRVLEVACFDAIRRS